MRIGSALTLAMIGAGLWPALSRLLGRAADPRPADMATSAAVHHSDPAARLDAGLYGATRDAGPGSMRDKDGRRWDTVDEASDESFPASDPPATY
jgi:hypothetical protein